MYQPNKREKNGGLLETIINSKQFCQQNNSGKEYSEVPVR